MEKVFEALDDLFDLVTCQGSFEKGQKCYDILEEAITELKAIKEAKPSEALECLDKIGNIWHTGYTGKIRETALYNTIKQALIKAQEMEKENAEYKQLEEQIGCSLEVREQALNGFYIDEYGYVSNDDDFIYLRKDDDGYYLKVVIHPSKPIPPVFYGYCDIHYLKDYKKTWWLREDKSE